jgi:hypothetical protein
MKPCIAFVAQGRGTSSWKPCPGKAHTQKVFCPQHEKILAGVMLGICVTQYPDDVEYCERQSLADMPVKSKVPS